MTAEERKIWNNRYAEGAYTGRTHPSQVLVDWIDRCPMGSALDIACGIGRNAMFLVERGYDVDAIDISSIALERAKQRASARSLDVNWIELDADDGLPTHRLYDLIVVIRYVNRQLFGLLPQFLNDNGMVLIEEHIETKELDAVSGPRNPFYRVKPGELQRALDPLQTVECFEGVVDEPDGSQSAVARILAQKVG